MLGFPDGSAGRESASVQETQVQSLGGKDPLGEEKATQSSVLAWKTPWTEEPGGCSPKSCTDSDVIEHELAHRRSDQRGAASSHF